MASKANHADDRRCIDRLTSIINIGESLAGDLVRIGIHRPDQLIGQDPWKLYCRISECDGIPHDPCVLDAMMSAVDYMKGGRPRKWWEYTSRRKRIYGTQLTSFRLRTADPRKVTRHKKRRRKHLPARTRSERQHD